MPTKVEFDPKEASRRFIEVRTNNHLTQGGLAERLGVAEQTVKNYEKAGSINIRDSQNNDRQNAIAGMKIETLFKMAKLFNVSADYLLCLSDDHRINHSAVDELGLSAKTISWLEWLKYQSECDSNYKKNINSIFEDDLFQRAFFNMVNYILALDVETLSFQSYIQKMEFGPGRESEAWQAYADEILLLSQDPKFSERKQQLLKAEYERFTLDKEALWAVLSGDDVGFHFSKMFAYRANAYFASLLAKYESESQKQRDEYTAHVLNSLDSEE